MEFLKLLKFYGCILVLLLFGNHLLGQDYEQVRMAFKESYRYEKEGEFSQAIESLKKVYDEDSYEINLRLGWLNYQAGVFSESIAHYQRALNLKPYAEEARFGLILPKAAIGKWEEVVNLYEEILKSSPNQTVACYRLGLIYYGRKEYEKAKSLFQKVVDLYPFGYDGLVMLAWTNLHLGKRREARILFEKSLWYSPNDTSALEGLRMVKE